MSASIYIFATRSDYEPVIDAVESVFDLQYAKYDLSPDPVIPIYRSGLDLPSLGVADSGDWGLEPQYIVLAASHQMLLRPVPQRRGGFLYKYDLTQWSIMFSPGGVFEAGTLIAGEVGTASDDPEAIALFKSFARVIRKRFTRVQEFWLGPEAFALFESGARLTTNVKRPREYDLRRSG